MSNEKKNDAGHPEGEKRLIGSYFPQYTGLTHFCSAPAEQSPVLTDELCKRGFRRLPHPDHVGPPDRRTEVTCPGLSYAPLKGKPGSSIQPVISPLSRIAPARPDHAQSSLHLGNYLGGLALHWSTSDRAVETVRIDPISDPTNESGPLANTLRIRESEGFLSSFALHITREPLRTGVTSAYTEVISPVLSTGTDRRLPKFAEGLPEKAESSAPRDAGTIGRMSLSPKMTGAVVPPRATVPTETPKQTGKPAGVEPLATPEQKPVVVVHQNGGTKVEARVANLANNATTLGNETARQLPNLEEVATKGLLSSGYRLMTPVTAIVERNGALIPMDQLLDPVNLKNLQDALSKSYGEDWLPRFSVALAYYGCRMGEPRSPALTSDVTGVVLDDLLQYPKKERTARFQAFGAKYFPILKALPQEEKRLIAECHRSPDYFRPGGKQ